MLIRYGLLQLRLKKHLELFSHVEAWAYPAIVGVLLLMVAKECVDYYIRKEQFDWKDVVAGLVGAFVGVLMCLL